MGMENERSVMSLMRRSATTTNMQNLDTVDAHFGGHMYNASRVMKPHRGVNTSASKFHRMHARSLSDGDLAAAERRPRAETATALPMVRKPSGLRQSSRGSDEEPE